jgi:hypothetical protein
MPHSSRAEVAMKKLPLVAVMVGLSVIGCGYVSAPSEKVRLECERNADIYYSEYREKGYYWIGMDGKRHVYEEMVANCMGREGFAPSWLMSLYIQFKKQVATKNPENK